jgi:hypothetical protein
MDRADRQRLNEIKAAFSRNRLSRRDQAWLLDFIDGALDAYENRATNVNTCRNRFIDHLNAMIRQEAKALLKERPDIKPASGFHLVASRVQGKLAAEGRDRPKPCRQTITKAIGPGFFRQNSPEKKDVISIYTNFPRPTYSLTSHST